MKPNEVDRRLAARERLWTLALEGISLAGKTVLDAGTGEGHFTRFLAAQQPARLVSITCHEAEIAPARARLAGLACQAEFRVADLTAMPAIPADSFDVVGADFLIAAVAAYSPYREVECLRELQRVLRPGGRLILSGWEVWPEVRHPTERTIRQLFQLRAAVQRLAGIEGFREHPRHWIANRLGDLGMPPERTVTVPDIHHDFQWFITNLERLIDQIEPVDLRLALARRLTALADQLRADADVFAAGFEFGCLYAVIACKLAGGLLLNV